LLIGVNLRIAKRSDDFPPVNGQTTNYLINVLIKSSSVRAAKV
jgi:hypothetical protein